ncbi:RNA polymerase sigma-54 factor [Paenibacillus albilobatus]|uniref:RNA polymerase sigma-54 factor n=1 Tax=Paenibacillus albilobatus TaxID=2716884 RepID=A0A919XEH7_9BACL|nr:RNA polymerase sigma-54 factor [Paenibacillus albilobatus]
MLGYQLVQDQRLKLAITPELKQSIHILSLPGDELLQYLQEQATENPVLELEIRRETPVTDAKIGRGGGSPPMDPFLNAACRQDTMEEKLLSQLRLLSIPPAVFKAAAYMAGNLNDDGYLDVPLAEIGKRLNVGEPLLELALEKLQSLEPAGIAGRDLRECLRLQIVRDPKPVPFALDVVEGYMQDAASGNVGRIASELRITKEQAARALQYIRSLNPRPGTALGVFEPQFIVPDAVVERHAEGFTVSLHRSSLPRLSISDEYRLWAKKHPSAEAMSYVNRCVKSAAWLVRCVEMRKATLLKVVHAMMEEQREFVSDGVKGLRPMTLNKISQKLNMHESTVSRAVNGKFALTPHGVFPLKYFFAAGVASGDGGLASSRMVKARIKEMIDAEDKSRPYSDQNITDLLALEGIRLSRRAVAKYREELRIMSSSGRKNKI